MNGFFNRPRPQKETAGLSVIATGDIFSNMDFEISLLWEDGQN